MKKKVIDVLAVVVITAIWGYNVCTSQNNVRLSNLALNNVEALADNENEGNIILYCCGNIGVCAKGPDADTGQEIFMRGTLSTKPCN